ncbi:MAG: Xaa-Pro peptidase family protein [Alphaproteobacteria bacterium]|nr:Xaa-Pro peptidase family protein [Alphaproteobacteria bacterium]
MSTVDRASRADSRPPGKGSLAAFDAAEYRRRVAWLQRRMREKGAALLIADAAEYLAYLAGFDISTTMYRACLVPESGDPVMVLRVLDEGPFLETTWLSEHVPFRDFDDPVAVVARTIAARGLAKARIAVDLQSHSLTVRGFEALKRALPDAAFVDMSDDLMQMGLVKSAAEIECLRRASAIVDAVMLETIEAAEPGMTEREMQAIAAAGFARHGADQAPVGPVTSGTGENFLHGRTHDRPMRNGDILHLELIPRYRGYSARLMRSTVLGGPSEAQARVARQLAAIQDRQFRAMKPGAAARDVDAIARQGVLDAGLRPSYDNITGYTLGYYPLSTPRSSNFHRAFLPSAGWTLEDGMVFHMYISAQGLAFSETVLVTADGAERLTRLERKVFAR